MAPYRVHYVVVNTCILLHLYFMPVQAYGTENYYLTDYCTSPSNVIRTTFTDERAAGVLLASRSLPYSKGLDCNITIQAPKNNSIILRVENVTLPSQNHTCLDYIEIRGFPKAFEDVKLCSSGQLILNSSTILIHLHSSNSTKSLSSFSEGYFRMVFTTYSEIYNSLNFDLQSPEKWTPFNYRRDYDFTIPTYNFRPFTPPTFDFRPITIPNTIWNKPSYSSTYGSGNVVIYVVVILVVLIIKLVVYSCCKAIRKDAQAREALTNSPPSTYPIGPQRFPASGPTAPRHASSPLIQENYGALVEVPASVYVDLPPPYSQTNTEEPPPPYDEKKPFNPPNHQIPRPSTESHPQSTSTNSSSCQTSNLPQVHASSLSSERNPQNHPIYSISFPRKNT